MLLLELSDESVRVYGLWTGSICGNEGDTPRHKLPLLLEVSLQKRSRLIVDVDDGEGVKCA